MSQSINSFNVSSLFNVLRWRKLLGEYMFFLIVSLGLIFSFGQSLSKLRQPMIGEYDAYRRLNLAIEKLQQPFDTSWWRYYTIWPPFHFYLIGWPAIFNLPYESSRWVAFVIAWLAIPGMIWLATQLLKNLHLGLLTGFLLSILPLWQYLAVTTLADSAMLTFIIWSLALLISSQPRHWLLGIVLLNIAHGIRFEAWFFLPFIWWLIIVIHPKHALKLIIGSCIFPIYWLIFNWVYVGSPWGFFAMKYAETKQSFPPEAFNLFRSFLVWWRPLYSDITSVGLGLILVSFLQLGRARKITPLLILGLSGIGLFFWTVFQMYSGTMQYHPHRLLLLVLVLLLPIIVNGLAIIYQYIVKRLAFNQQLMLSGTLILSYFLINRPLSYDNLYLPLEFFTDTNNITPFKQSIFSAKKTGKFIYFSPQFYSIQKELVGYYLKTPLSDSVKICESETNIETAIADGFLVLAEKNCPVNPNPNFEVLVENNSFILIEQKQ